MLGILFFRMGKAAHLDQLIHHHINVALFCMPVGDLNANDDGNTDDHNGKNKQ